LIAIDRETNYRIADITANLNKCSELNMKDYEIAMLAAIAINGDPVNSIETNLKIDAVEILMIFVFIRNVDIYQIS
jgi:hypothetical protein